ncbi:MAG: aminotransferase class V-fold PLP-dependent enzyme [Nanoarchaeota archaeon]|nr:aminotransferase class V-fold PLP-dependent enzyme [Nanoarchaeota archaeon]
MPVFPKYSHTYNFQDFLIAISGIFLDYSSKLKKELKKILKKDYNIYFLDSGRSALNIILKDLNLPKGSEVAIPANICEVVVETILRNDLKPLLIDITDNLTICPNDLKKKITHNTKVIIPVHAFGNLYDIEEIQNIAKANGCIVIEDSAQTFTSKYNGKNVGIFGDYAFFSLDVTKHISAFGGGVLVTKKPIKIKTKQELGIKKILELIAFKFLTNKIIYTFLTKNIIPQIKSISYYPPRNKKLSKIGIALAYSQIKKIEEINNVRKENVRKIIALIEDKLKIYSQNKNRAPSYTVLPLGVKKKIKIEKYLEKIIDLPKPVPLLTRLKKYETYWNDCPNAEIIQNQLILLPTYIKVNRNIEKIIKNIKHIN